MTHLTRDELVGWRDDPDESLRDRVLSHLAACDTCGAVYAELMRTRPSIEDPIALQPRDFVAAGIAAAGTGRTAWLRRRAVWVGLPAMAAAALVAFAVLRQPRVAPLSDPTSDIRGSEIVAFSPTGTVSQIAEFKWTSPFRATTYRLSVKSQDGAVVWTKDSPQEHAAATTLPPGRYTWKVDAFDAAGRVIASSRDQPFEIRR
jgi:hypothetical protein